MFHYTRVKCLYKHSILLSPLISYEENEVLRIWPEVFVTFDDILVRAKPKQRLWYQMPFGGLQIGRSAWHPNSSNTLSVFRRAVPSCGSTSAKLSPRSWNGLPFSIWKGLSWILCLHEERKSSRKCLIFKIVFVKKLLKKKAFYSNLSTTYSSNCILS